MVFFGLVTLTYLPFSIALKDKKNWSGCNVWVKRTLKAIRWLCIMPVFVKHQERFSNQQCIVVANHASYVDILAMFEIIPGDFAFLGKAELKQWPLFGQFFSSGLHVAVERKNVVKRHASYQQALDKLNKGVSIAIFPEGGIKPEAPKLAPFHAGAFRMAIEKQLPIVPVTIINSARRFESNDVFFGPASPGAIRAIVHEPVSTSGLELSDLIHLRNQVFDTINHTLNEGK